MRFAKSKIFQEALIIKFTTSVWSFQGALKTAEGKAEVPSLDKEGWLRPLRKCREASLAGADGVVGSSHRLSEVERTTPAAPPKERDRLLDGAATPPLPRSIQSCPAGQRQNTQETAPSKTKDLSAQFLERGVWTYLLPASAGRGRNAKFEM